MNALKLSTLALASLLATTAAQALVAVEVAGITSKDGGRTFYLKQGTPTTEMLSATERIPYRAVQYGGVTALQTRSKGRIVLEFSADETAMASQWNMFKSISSGGLQKPGVVQGNRIYVDGDLSYYGPSAWTLSSANGISFTVSGWSEMNWWQNPNPPCVAESELDGIFPGFLEPGTSFPSGAFGPCTQTNGSPGWFRKTDVFAPLPNPPAGTPAPVTLTLKEYVPATISTNASTSISSQITFANEDVGLQGQVFAALLIDGRYYFINSDKATVTQYRGESSFPALYSGVLNSGAFVLWTNLSAEDRALMRQLGAKLFVGYGTGATQNAAIADLLKVDTRLPTTTKQLNGQRYVLAVDANQW